MTTISKSESCIVSISEPSSNNLSGKKSANIVHNFKPSTDRMDWNSLQKKTDYLEIVSVLAIEANWIQYEIHVWHISLQMSYVIHPNLGTLKYDFQLSIKWHMTPLSIVLNSKEFCCCFRSIETENSLLNIPVCIAHLT